MIERTPPTRFLVTGGAGFVGSNVVHELNRRFPAAKIVVLDDLFTGTWDNLKPSDNIERVEGSVTNRDLVYQLVDNADLIFHLAARNIIASTKDPRNDYETNIGGTLNMLVAARDLGMKKVVYSSSASVYGNPRTMPISEDGSISTLSPYAVSKLAGENYCLAFYESFGLPTVCLRYSNVFGPGQDPRNPYCGVVAKFIESALENRNINVHGDGEQTRDFTFIDDCVDATISAGLSPRGEGDVFNVATGVETSINNVARIIIQLLGSSSEVVPVERRDIDNIRRRVLNIEHIRRVLRWVPRNTIQRGLEKTVAWQKSLALHKT